MKKILLIGLSFCAASTGCDRQLDTFRWDAGPASHADSGPTDSGSTEPSGVSVVPADILFIVDNSCSMAEEQENLAENFERFVNQTIGAGSYRMGIITTDMDGLTQRAGYVDYHFSSMYPYELAGVNPDGCHETGEAHGCFRGARIDSAIMDRQTQIDTFTQNIRVGTCGAGVERGLDAMLSALDQMGPGECNEGFLRDEANLLVVIVSDEDDASDSSIQTYVDALQTYKPITQIRVATISGMFAGQPSNCSVGLGDACGSLCQDTPPTGSGTPCSSNASCSGNEICTGVSPNTRVCQTIAQTHWGQCASCSYFSTSDCCQAVPGSRYVQLAQEVERRVNAARPEFPVAGCLGLGSRVSCLTDTICQTSFGDTLARIARELVLSAP